MAAFGKCLKKVLQTLIAEISASVYHCFVFSARVTVSCRRNRKEKNILKNSMALLAFADAELVKKTLRKVTGLAKLILLRYSRKKPYASASGSLSTESN